MVRSWSLQRIYNLIVKMAGPELEPVAISDLMAHYRASEEMLRLHIRRGVTFGLLEMVGPDSVCPTGGGVFPSQADRCAVCSILLKEGEEADDLIGNRKVVVGDLLLCSYCASKYLT